MRVAVMSDIHGFSLALDAVTSDIERHGLFDAVVVAGDLCAVGPDPAGVIERLRARPDWVVLKGNTDDDIVQAATRREMWFPVAEIGREGAAFLEDLPLITRYFPPGSVDDDQSLLVVHANPHDLTGRLDPESSDRELREVLGDARFDTIAFGHVHIAYQRELDGRKLVDVSAVGNPKDGSLRSAWGEFTWDTNTGYWTSTIHRTDYPLAETERQIRDSRLPSPDKVLQKLIRARY
ncbi:MAG TPA: metallophosphoesterase [Thermomicrobiales bacterium]|jgi:predicted phosphodiesterase|nr:metallophosphoesterase [Thermomicrobiales bacterium]